MNKPMIENSERGITVNKTLAWTMVVGLLAGGYFIGTELSSTKTLLSEIKLASEASRVEMRTVTSDIDSRLRAVETTRAGDGVEINILRRDFNDMRAEVRGMRSDIQQLTQAVRQQQGEGK